jgi:polysaccharide export outer membrane protein
MKPIETRFKMDFTYKRKGFLILWLLSILGWTLASCASAPVSKEAGTAPVPGKEFELSMQIKEMNERLMRSGLPPKQTSDQDYKIGPDDLLEISVNEDEKFNKTVKVSSQGNIKLPLIGILKVNGLTGIQLEREIESLLAEQYIYDPHVTVIIKEHRNQRISVMGAVARPGTYDFTGQTSVSDVLVMTGGLREDAGPLLFLTRSPGSGKPKPKNEPDGQKPNTFVISLEDLLLNAETDSNLALMHGDVINIPVAGKVFVGGAVKNPGGFALAKRMTLSQAITMAQGLTPKAKGSVTRIFRYSQYPEKKTQKEILVANVNAIYAGEEQDLYLKENDVIFVPQSTSKTILIEFWDLLKGQIMSFHPYAL